MPVPASPSVGRRECLSYSLSSYSSYRPASLDRSYTSRSYSSYGSSSTSSKDGAGSSSYVYHTMSRPPRPTVVDRKVDSLGVGETRGSRFTSKYTSLGSSSTSSQGSPSRSSYTSRLGSSDLADSILRKDATASALRSRDSSRRRDSGYGSSLSTYSDRSLSRYSTSPWKETSSSSTSSSTSTSATNGSRAKNDVEAETSSASSSSSSPTGSRFLRRGGSTDARSSSTSPSRLLSMTSSASSRRGVDNSRRTSSNEVTTTNGEVAKSVVGVAGVVASASPEPSEDANGNRLPVSELRRLFDANANCNGASRASPSSSRSSPSATIPDAPDDQDDDDKNDASSSSSSCSSSDSPTPPTPADSLRGRSVGSASVPPPSQTAPSNSPRPSSQAGSPQASRRPSRTAVNGVSSDANDSDVIPTSPQILRRYRHDSAINERGGLVGLRNIGNTCFMNSVIQCLSNTKPLLEYLLRDNYLSDINTSTSSMKGALIKAFGDVIRELWVTEERGGVVNTTSFKSQVQRFAPRFMGYSQQDAQEFLRYLLEGLHEDVNRVTSKPRSLAQGDIDDRLPDPQKAMEAWKRYLRLDDSKVVDIFVGQLKSTLRCTHCGHCSVTFDPFWDLSLSIPSRTGQVRLTQCFDLFAKEEVLDGDEKPTCSQCQVRRKCTKSFSIHKFPKILVLHLKRFSPTERYRGKLNTTVDFPLTGLDLSAYAATRSQGCVYDLYGMANHSGTTYSGHYTAHCRHPYSGDWHEYNDSRVSSLSPRNVVTSEAYLLFYELAGHSSHL